MKTEAQAARTFIYNPSKARNTPYRTFTLLDRRNYGREVVLPPHRRNNDPSSSALSFSSTTNSQFLLNQVKSLHKQLTAARQSLGREPHARSRPPPFAIISSRSGKAPPPLPLPTDFAHHPFPEELLFGEGHTNSKRREHRSRHSHSRRKLGRPAQSSSNSSRSRSPS